MFHLSDVIEASYLRRRRRRRRGLDGTHRQRPSAAAFDEDESLAAAAHGAQPSFWQINLWREKERERVRKKMGEKLLNGFTANCLWSNRFTPHL